MYIRDCRRILSSLKRGNILKCDNGDELFNYNKQVEALGFKTEFAYTYKGEAGFYIMIVGEPGEK